MQMIAAELGKILHLFPTDLYNDKYSAELISLYAYYTNQEYQTTLAQASDEERAKHPSLLVEHVKPIPPEDEEKLERQKILSQERSEKIQAFIKSKTYGKQR
jgi:hypothetical protein